jgi:hypothetical protein
MFTLLCLADKKDIQSPADFWRIVELVGPKNQRCREDVITCRDWKAWMVAAGIAPKGMGNYAVKQMTLHQFRARRVGSGDTHPPEEYNAGGVVLEYRKYSSDEVMEITAVSDGGRKGWGEGRYQFQAKNIRSHWWPAQVDLSARIVENLPQGEPPQAGQNADWKYGELFKSITAAIERGGTYHIRFEDAARDDWADFAARAAAWKAGNFLPGELCTGLVAKVLALRRGAQQEQQEQENGKFVKVPTMYANRRGFVLLRLIRCWKGCTYSEIFRIFCSLLCVTLHHNSENKQKRFQRRRRRGRARAHSSCASYSHHDTRGLLHHPSSPQRGGHGSGSKHGGAAHL